MCQCGHLENRSKAKQIIRQSESGLKQGSLFSRLPGSSVWPLDHCSWNKRQGKIQLSSRSTPNLQDSILLPPGSRLNLYNQVWWRTATVPPPPLQPAPRGAQKLQPPLDHMTLRQNPGLHHLQAHSWGTQWDWECLTFPNCCRFPHLQRLSLNHCIRS